MDLIYLNIPQPVARGRVCSYIASKLLRNPSLVYLIKNTDNIVVSGSKNNFEEELKTKRNRGSRRWGPFYPRLEDDQIRRCLRGMVSWTTKKGKEAYKRFFTKGEPYKIKEILLKQKIVVRRVLSEEFNTRVLSKYSPSIYVEK